MTHRADALRTLLFASSAAGMLMAAPAMAGDPATTADPQQDQDATTLNGVTVTGQRVRREPQSPEFVAPLVDTPRSVTIIPQQIIEQTNAMSLQDILQNSPGISFGAGEGGQPLADRPF
ncbi:MAG: TonB-dependent siderophore receptor, partial [Brevundimonas sp.]